MADIEEADSWIGRTAIDNTGEQVGLVTQIWVDDATGQPEWATVMIGLGRWEALVPLAGAAAMGGGLQFAYSRDQVVQAPRVAQDGRLSAEAKEQVSAYYLAPGVEPLVPHSASWLNIPVHVYQPFRSENTPPLAGSQPPPVVAKKASRFRRKADRSDEMTDGTAHNDGVPVGG